MLDLTKEEKLVLIFIATSFLIGSGVNFCKKQIQPVSTQEPIADKSKKSSQGRVNINTADINGLISIKGIGVKTAERIVEYRQQHGPFFYKEDIMKVKGIGKGKFEAIEKSVTTQ
jgi:competence ComEA-like helix-hairpin-helix protein